MARLPHPGGDSGNWGSILNDFLAQVHASDGTLKTDSVTSDAIAPNAVTSAAIAPNSITNTALASNAVDAAIIQDGSITNALIADGAIQETKLTTAVQNKINNPHLPDADATTKGVIQLTGDLGGTAANPSVAALSGVSISGTPSSGQVLTASGGTTASWMTLPTAPVTSVAGKTGAVSLVANDITNATTTGKSLIMAADATAAKTVLSLTKSDVGLSNVDNTSDATKNAATATLTNKTLTNPKIDNIISSASQRIVEFTASGAAANYTQFYAPSVGNPVQIGAVGTDTNVGINFVPKGTGTVQANGVDVVTTTGTQTLTNKTLTSPMINDSNGNTMLGFIANANAVNYVGFENSSLGVARVRALGSSADVSLQLAPKGAGVVLIQDGNSTTVLKSGSLVASAVNNITVSNAATGSAPSIAASGTDTNVGINLISKGSGTVQANGVDVVTTTGTQSLTNKSFTSAKIANIYDITNNTKILGLTGAASAVNYVQFGAWQTGIAPTIFAMGSDTNVSLNLMTQGTGTVQANSVDVVTTMGTQTLTNKTLTSPVIGTNVKDINGNIMFAMNPVANAVNYFRFSNNDATSVTVGIDALGSSSDISIGLTPKGSGVLQIWGGSSQTVRTIQAASAATDVSLNLTTKNSGTVQANGVPVATTTGTQTIQNKTFDTTNTFPRVQSATATSTATPSINTDAVSIYGLTSQAVDITSVTVTGTPVNGQKLLIFIVGTASRAITWGSSFENGPASLPGSTSSTQRLDVGFVWNATTSKWRCMASGSA